VLTLQGLVSACKGPDGSVSIATRLSCFDAQQLQQHDISDFSTEVTLVLQRTQSSLNGFGDKRGHGDSGPITPSGAEFKNDRCYTSTVPRAFKAFKGTLYFQVF